MIKRGGGGEGSDGAVSLFWERGGAGASGEGGGRCRPGNVAGGGRRTTAATLGRPGEDVGQCGEEGRGRASVATRCRHLRFFSFYGGATVAVVVADVVSAAAEVASTWAEGSISMPVTVDINISGYH